jgi:hypothetical protein
MKFNKLFKMFILGGFINNNFYWDGDQSPLIFSLILQKS